MWSAYICARMRDCTCKPGPVTLVSKYNNLLFTIRIVCISSTCTLITLYTWRTYICRIRRVSYISSTHVFMAILDYYIYTDYRNIHLTRAEGWGCREAYVINSVDSLYSCSLPRIQIQFSTFWSPFPKGRKCSSATNLVCITNTYMFRGVG